MTVPQTPKGTVRKAFGVGVGYVGTADDVLFSTPNVLSVLSVLRRGYTRISSPVHREADFQHLCVVRVLRMLYDLEGFKEERGCLRK